MVGLCSVQPLLAGLCPKLLHMRRFGLAGLTFVIFGAGALAAEAGASPTPARTQAATAAVIPFVTRDTLVAFITFATQAP